MSIVPGVPGTRYDRIGTIFSRITGLIRAGTISGDNIPIWYAVYKAFPPKYEPVYSRKPPNIKLSTLAYREDDDRAALHALKQVRPIDLTRHITDESFYFKSQSETEMGSSTSTVVKENSSLDKLG